MARKADPRQLDLIEQAMELIAVEDRALQSLIAEFRERQARIKRLRAVASDLEARFVA